MCGWIKLHRALLDSPVFENDKMLKVWVWCLLKASHSHREQMVGLQRTLLKPGQFITGRASGSKELGMKESTFWVTTKTLEKCGNINIKSNNKFSVITVVKWGQYQNGDAENNSKSNNRITTKPEIYNTNKNVEPKNVKPKPLSDLTITSEGKYEKVAEIWNRVFAKTTVPKIREMNPNRRTWFKRELSKQRKRLKTIDDFEAFFIYLRDGCTCDEGSWFSFDWLFKYQNNFIKAWEGNYDIKRLQKRQRYYRRDDG